MSHQTARLQEATLLLCW